MDREILHIYIPSFPITLARASNPSLRSRAVVVAPGHSERAPVQHLSGEARSEGIHEGMPLFRARRLCPSLVILPPDPHRLSGGIRALIRLTREYTPVWEPAAAGRIYLDFTGSTRLFGTGRDAALRLERDLERRLRLTGAVGVAGNKLVSKIAAECLDKPGICDVFKGGEAGFIAPLPAIVLPGVGHTREQTLLTDLNLRLVGQIAALTLPQLLLPFGPFAPLLHQRAKGVDPSPVLTPRRTPELAAECRLEREENDDTVLLAELYRLAEECGMRLRRGSKKAAKLTLTVHYADGVSGTRSGDVTPAASGDRALFENARRLYDRACERRVRVRSMRLLCEKITEPQRQIEMFEQGSRPKSQSESVQAALDAVRNRFGMSAVGWGRTAVQVQGAECRVQRFKPKTQNPKLKTWNRP
ncbi:MAG: DNA polymerase IV [bacterium]|nr:DNA polymerase IV [bacterium]